MPQHCVLVCDKHARHTTRVAQVPCGGISLMLEATQLFLGRLMTSVKLGVVPPRGGAIPTILIIADEIVVLKLSWHVPLPGCLLHVFHQLFWPRDLGGGSFDYFLFGLIPWDIVLPHHENFTVIVGVRL
jgi:hypothetical protein